MFNKFALLCIYLCAWKYIKEKKEYIHYLNRRDKRTKEKYTIFTYNRNKRTRLFSTAYYFPNELIVNNVFLT